MSNVRLTWTLPDVSLRQSPIDYVRVEFRVDETFPWTEQDVVPAADPQELLFVDVAPGTFFYQVTIVDVNGLEGAPAFVQVDVAFDAPGVVLDLTAVEE